MDGVYETKISDKSNKRNAYTAMCGVGILCLAMSVFTSIFSVAVGYFDTYILRDVQHFLVRLFSKYFDVSTLQSVLAVKKLFTSSGFEDVLSMIGSLIFMFIPALVFSKLCGNSFSDCFPVSGKKVKGVVFVFAAMELFLISSSAFSKAFYSFCFPGVTDVSASSVTISTSDGFSVFISILHIAVFVPIVEEFIFRGAIFRCLEKYGTGFAVVASAAIFGMMHTSPVQSVYAFTFGLFSAMLLVVTGNIKTSVLFHALNNLITLGQDYIPTLFGEKTNTLCNSIYYVFIITFGIYGIYRLFREDGIIESFRTKCRRTEEKRESYPGINQLLCITVLLYIGLYVYNYLYPIVMP